VVPVVVREAVLACVRTLRFYIIFQVGYLLYTRLLVYCSATRFHQIQSRSPPSERQTAIIKFPERHLYLVTQLSVGLRQLVRRDLGDKLRVDRHDEVTYRTVIDLIDNLNNGGKMVSGPPGSGREDLMSASSCSLSRILQDPYRRVRR
jgi:hypothetical protein